MTDHTDLIAQCRAASGVTPFPTPSCEFMRRVADALEAQGRELAGAYTLLHRTEDEKMAQKRRLADAEREQDTLLGMIRHQRDVLRECLPYLNESMAGRRPGRTADDIRAAVKALTADQETLGNERETTD